MGKVFTHCICRTDVQMLRDKNCSDITIFYGTTSVQMSCFMGQQYSDVAIFYGTVCAEMLYEATSHQILLCFM
ncbi:hypothetical protein B7P43_G03765 [Cryptotermes secundus]|uniref:Uncharacterized protein n=1 Tax=Cryptotermes secundus TaxID=105785 RepID=A0A2J7R1X5_9NEOP|nr:hypothetical protein B7P43_G03765 [Cryptotermes secundus]